MSFVSLAIWAIGLSLLTSELIKFATTRVLVSRQAKLYTSSATGSFAEFSRSLEIDRAVASSWGQRLGFVLIQHPPTQRATSTVRVREAELWASYDTTTTIIAPIVKNEADLNKAVERFSSESGPTSSVAGVFVKPNEDIHYAIDRTLAKLARSSMLRTQLGLVLVLVATACALYFFGGVELLWPVWLLAIATASGTFIAGGSTLTCSLVAIVTSLAVLLPQFWGEVEFQPAVALLGVGVFTASVANRSITKWRTIAVVLLVAGVIDSLSFMFGPTSQLRNVGVFGSGSGALETAAVIQPPFGDWSVGAIDIVMVSFVVAVASRLRVKPVGFIVLIMLLTLAAFQVFGSIPFIPIIALGFLLLSPNRMFAELEGRS